jgi:hypothetical protein
VIDPAEVVDLVGRWWWNYDEGNFEVLRELLTDDVHFTCRTDTGETDFEEFVRADVRGREAVMAWQIPHRTNSPYPLRHNGTNVHVTEQRGGEVSFASYIYVTRIVAGQVASLSSGVVLGAARRCGSSVCLCELHVVLDTRTSDLFSVVRS